MCHEFAPGITEDDERRPWREIVYKTEVGAWSVSSVCTARDVAPDGTCMIMIGHSFVSLLFLAILLDMALVMVILAFSVLHDDSSRGP